MKLIKKERENNKTVIVITHNVEFAFEYIPRTILMADGNIIADGPTQKVLNNEKLVVKSSLVLPQSRELSLALQSEGFQNTDNLLSTSDATDYLIQFFKNNIRRTQEG